MRRSLPKGLTREEQILAHFKRLVVDHPQGRKAIGLTACSTRASVKEIYAVLKENGITPPDRIPSARPPRGRDEATDERIRRLYARHTAAGLTPIEVARKVRSTLRWKMEDLSAALVRLGLAEPEAEPRPVIPETPKDRAKRLYTKRLAEGQEPGDALGRVCQVMNLKADAVRALLQTHGIAVPKKERPRMSAEEAERAAERHREQKAAWKKNKRAEERAKQPATARAPKPITSPKPAPVRIKAAWTDNGGYAPVDERELLRQAQAGKTVRFVPARDIFAEAAR